MVTWREGNILKSKNAEDTSRGKPPGRSANARAAFDPGARRPVVVTDVHQGFQFRALWCVDSTHRDAPRVVLIQICHLVRGRIAWRNMPWRFTERSVARAREPYSPDFFRLGLLWHYNSLLWSSGCDSEHVGSVSARLPVAFLSRPFSSAGSGLSLCGEWKGNAVLF